MAKAFVWIGMLAVLFGGVYFMLDAMTGDSGKLYGYAVGEANSNNQHPLQVVVGPMDVLDGPTRTVSEVSTQPDWNHWLSQHYFLTDAAGNPVEMKKGGFSSPDIDQNQAGAAEFIALATLDAGKTYTLEVVPVLAEPEKYIQKIEGAEKEFRRTTFDANY